MLIGYVEKEAKNWRYIRKLCFTMIKLLGDPKYAPTSETAYWPIDGDPVTIKLSTDQVKHIADKFRNTTWTLKSPSK